MNKDSIISTVRMILISLGGYLVGKNIFGSTATTDSIQELAGVVMTVVMAVWGFFDKSNTLESLQSAARSLIQFVGGVLVAKGKVSADSIGTFTAAALPLIAWIYSLLSKAKSANLKSVVSKLDSTDANSINDVKVAMSKLKILIPLILISGSLSAQSFFKPKPIPEKLFGGTTTVTTKNFWRPIASVAATTMNGAQLAGGFGISYQHDSVDNASQKYVSIYQISALAWIATPPPATVGTGSGTPSFIVGAVIGLANGLFQFGYGRDITNKANLIITGTSIPF